MIVSLWWKWSQQKLKLVIFKCNKAFTLMNCLGKLNGRIWGCGGEKSPKQPSELKCWCNATTSRCLWGNSFGLKGHTWSHFHSMLVRHFLPSKKFVVLFCFFSKMWQKCETHKSKAVSEQISTRLQPGARALPSPARRSGAGAAQVRRSRGVAGRRPSASRLRGARSCPARPLAWEAGPGGRPRPWEGGKRVELGSRSAWIRGAAQPENGAQPAAEAPRSPPRGGRGRLGRWRGKRTGGTGRTGRAAGGGASPAPGRLGDGCLAAAPGGSPLPGLAACPLTPGLSRGGGRASRLEMPLLQLPCDSAAPWGGERGGSRSRSLRAVRVCLFLVGPLK